MTDFNCTVQSRSFMGFFHLGKCSEYHQGLTHAVVLDLVGTPEEVQEFLDTGNQLLRTAKRDGHPLVRQLRWGDAIIPVNPPGEALDYDLTARIAWLTEFGVGRVSLLLSVG